MNKKILFVIVILLAIIPFFWLKPGEMDLGGDSSRLYFYDPYNYLRFNLLFAIIPTGFNIEQPLLLAAPLVGLLTILKSFIRSPYLLITLFNSINLVVAFLSMYGILRELLSYEKKKHSLTIFLAAIFTGLYYVFSPNMVRSAWDKALITHAQIFLNPLAFYLLLRYVKTNKVVYVLVLLLITVLFSVNFSWASAPILLGFYPPALLFLFLYSKLAKLKINYLPLLFSGILFILLHMFHFAPLVMQVLDKSGAAFSRTFTSQNQYDIGLSYFVGTAPNIKLSENLLGLPQMVPNIIPFKIVFFFVPALLLLGLWLNTKGKWDQHTRIGFVLFFSIFLLLLFFITANITNSGFEFYKGLFKIPGFSMFRNFYGQWMFGYLFYFAVLLGYSLFYVLSSVKNLRVQYLIFILLIGVTVVSAYPFIQGKMVNLVLNTGQKKEFKIPIKMDPEYEKVLQYIRDDSIDAKYFSLPFTEAFHQQLAGTQQGMYQGPSTISLLTGHSDFIGYQVLPPFNEALLSLAKKKKYDDIARLLGLLNVRYVFYNSDENIMAYFPDFPYQHVKNFFPVNQSDYKKFISGLPIKKKKDFGGKYYIYTLSDTYYLPPVYIAKEALYFKKDIDAWGNLKTSFFAGYNGSDPRVIYVEDKKYKKYISDTPPKITFQKINPTKYKIQVRNAKGPYILSMSHAFNPNWKLFLSPKSEEIQGNNATYFKGDINEAFHSNIFFDSSAIDLIGQRQIADQHHFLANAYSNGWVITPSDVNNKQNYTLIVEMISQRTVYASLLISTTAFIVLLGWLGFVLVRARKIKK